MAHTLKSSRTSEIISASFLSGSSFAAAHLSCLEDLKGWLPTDALNLTLALLGAGKVTAQFILTAILQLYSVDAALALGQ
jgi:hypothetical protein